LGYLFVVSCFGKEIYALGIVLVRSMLAVAWTNFLNLSASDPRPVFAAVGLVDVFKPLDDMLLF